MTSTYDILVVGGGFYGCCLALYLKTKTSGSVLLIEKEVAPMLRASSINQARVHTGFHYPRSLVTAMRSLWNFPRFVLEFREAVVDDFTMLYAVARQGSKVNAKRFWKMYTAMKAPIKVATMSQKALFTEELIEDVFAVQEHAFNHEILRRILEERMHKEGVDILLETEAFSCQKYGEETQVLTNRGEFRASRVFNCTYSRINCFLVASGIPPVALKHEITEMALIKQPASLEGMAVTVMDGPFFSIMPYPARNCYSLSHVRYTPHSNWTDGKPCHDPHVRLNSRCIKSAFPLMIRDVARFIPGITFEYIGSMFEVKTVLSRNESDDGRPILCTRHPELGNVFSVMGSKLDNVYDLFEGLKDVVIKSSPKGPLC